MTVNDGTTLEALVARQKPGFSLEQPFYGDEEIFKLDLERIVAKQWLYVDHASRLPNTGDYLLFPVGDEEIIIARDEAGEINAFFNVCRHRGSRICLEEHGNALRLACPYHAWTWSLSGDLVAARRMPEGFDKADYPLHRCHVRVFDGMIFINLAEGEPTDFDIIIKTLDPFVSHFAIGRTKIVHRETYPTHGNWKLAVENFRECYHCAPAHPEYTMVNAYVNANDRKDDAYTPTVEAWNEKTAAMGHPTGRLRNSTDLPEQPHGASRRPIREGFLTLSEDGRPVAPLLGDIKEFDGGECMVIFGPLFYLYCANDHITTFRFTPVNGQLTDVVLTWLVREDAAAGDYDVDRLKWMWDVTTIQDTTIIGDNQTGVNSSRYTPGPYSEREGGTTGFIKWYLSQISPDANRPTT
jgi:phenylpropionate dioxygenase-like ring-hydroxylating dioxygenase large terminal subunit